MKEFERSSRILIDLPPLDSLIKNIRKYLEKNLEEMPEFIETSGLLGFAIDWPTWTFSGISGYMKKVQTKYDCPIIEYIDENHFDFLGQENYCEIFQNIYFGEETTTIKIFPDYIDIGRERVYYSGLRVRHLDLIKALGLLETLKILYRRGYLNKPNVDFELKCWFRDNV